MYATVLVTAPDLQVAKKLARVLIEGRLAACANILPIASTFRWKGEVSEEDEYAILLKTRSEDFDLVKMEIQKHHPYEVPCIVKYEISDGARSYLDWISESTRRPPR